MNNLRDNQDGSCNCSPLSGGCFFAKLENILRQALEDTVLATSIAQAIAEERARVKQALCDVYSTNIQFLKESIAQARAEERRRCWWRWRK